jgi:8-oxo-dGTP diphosphatase
VRGGRLRPGDDAADARWVDAAAFDQLDLTEGLSEILLAWGHLPTT